ncbi:protein Frey 1 [Macrotis lagotis]|uniref:protein Frey 1 n=1 Tax=Macrotis lagotis TaxID=92651 RepID=UPI003D699CEA
MLGSLCPRIGLGIFLFALVLVAVYPQPQRYQTSSISEELDPVDLPNGLMDDYGILPKHPGLRIVRPFLSKAQKRKRDGPDLSEYYYDAHPDEKAL